MANINALLCIFCCCASVFFCEGYKILTVFPLPSKSHGILGDNMVKHLLNAGHEVTYVTPFLMKNDHPNLRLIDVTANKKLFNEESMNIKEVLDGSVKFDDHVLMFNIMHEMTTETLANPNFQELMKDTTQTFDVVIGEYMFSDLYSTLGAVFQSPFIWFSTIDPHWMILQLVDKPLNPAYNSDYLKDSVAPYSFTERVRELWHLVVSITRRNFVFYYKEEETYLKYIAPIIKEQGREVPSLYELKYNASLLLGNSQVVLGDAISLPACYKHIGGYHIDENVQPLPDELKTIMDNAKHGVIYFSLGSNMRSKDLPAELKEGLLKVFGGLKQTILWKFEEKLPNTPKNVHIVHWAPQQSILSHPNIKLFITHGGLLSVTESVHFGVPLIAVPIFGDQFKNANRAEKKGFAKRVTLSYNLHKDLDTALNEVLPNLPKYTAKVKELSLAYHDNLYKAKDELVHWVEHVIRTRGSPHLRSTALSIPLYQQLYLDLLFVIILAFISIRMIFKYLLSKVTTKVNIKKKSN